MKQSLSPLLAVAVLLGFLAGLSLELSAVPPCVPGVIAASDGSSEASVSDVVVLLDVSTSMFGVDDEDVIDRAVKELQVRLSGFQYGRILLMAFQGRIRSEFGRDAVSTWGFPGSIPESNTGRTWIGYEFRYPMGKSADLDGLWSVVDRACRAVRSKALPGAGTGTYIYETAADAARELRGYLADAMQENSGVIPYGYMQKIILVTDSGEVHDPSHETACTMAKQETAGILRDLYAQLGVQLTIQQLFWGPNCPEGDVPQWLGEFNYTCIPHNPAALAQQEVLVVPFPLFLRTSLNPAINDRAEIRVLSLCPSAPLPAGDMILSVDGVYIRRTDGTAAIPFRGGSDPDWVDLTSAGVHVGIAEVVETAGLAQVALHPSGGVGQFSPVSFFLVLDSEALEGLVREAFPDTQLSPREIVVTLRLGFVPSPSLSAAKVAFTDEVITIRALYEPPAMVVKVQRDQEALDTGTLEVLLNKPALDLARASGKQPELRVDYAASEIAVQGLDAEDRMVLPDLLSGAIRLPIRIARPAQTSTGERRVSITVGFSGLLRELVTLDVADVAMSPAPGGTPLVVDLHPYVSTEAWLQYPASLWVVGAESVSVTASMHQLPLPERIRVAIPEGMGAFQCSHNGSTWNLPFHVDFPQGVESLRQLNAIAGDRGGVDLELALSVATTDPDLFVTLPQGLLAVDLRYPENQILVRIIHSTIQTATVEPGTIVASLEVRCSPDVPTEAREVTIAVNPKLLVVSARGGVDEEAPGRYTVTSAPSSAKEEGRYDISIATGVWDCPVVSGLQRTSVSFRCASDQTGCAVPLEGESSIAFDVARRPALMPRVVPDPQEQAARWQGLSTSGEVAEITYDLAGAPSADIDLRVLVWTDGGALGGRDYFVVKEDDKNPGVFSIETNRAPYGARGVLELVAVDTACGLAVEAPSRVEFSIETVMPRVFWVGMLAFLGLSTAAAGALVVYSRLESQTLFETVDYLWGFERWMLLAGGGFVVMTIAMTAAFLAVR